MGHLLKCKSMEKQCESLTYRKNGGGLDTFDF